MKAVVLLSGGLDSCVSATLARDRCEDLFALSFIYGQKHEREINSAKRIGKYLGVKEHKFVTVQSDLFRTSSLVDKNLEIEERDVDEIGRNIPSTYVPARNTIFLSYALAFAESRDADFIYIGVNALDYSGYPDCRPEYIEAFQRVADLGTRRGVKGKGIKISTTKLIQNGTNQKSLRLLIFDFQIVECQSNRTGETCQDCP
ncbi:MAG: 7-cyano-7-deazaguanine synthase QueC [Candidatus Altiarchaeales archaeon ex4484_43]|nr:MAG: 7-cyano-7-deazaguanine synthase QueC [Candidatus Altiarchaeales archaeon ex4484_43]